MQVETASNQFNDWSGLLALLKESFAYMEGRIDPPSSLNAMTEETLRSKAATEHLIVAHDAGRLVGCAYADVRSSSVYVGKVAVASDVRGRGVARRLLEVAECLASASGRPVLELQTRVELIENHNAFAALGFRTVSQSAHPGYSRPTSITMQRSVERPPPCGRTLR